MHKQILQIPSKKFILFSNDNPKTNPSHILPPSIVIVLGRNMKISFVSTKMWSIQHTTLYSFNWNVRANQCF